MFIFACPGVMKVCFNAFRTVLWQCIQNGSLASLCPCGLRWFAKRRRLERPKGAFIKAIWVLWTKKYNFQLYVHAFHHSRFHFDLMKIQFLQKHACPFTLLVSDKRMLDSSGVWCKLVNMIRPETQFYTADKSQLKKSLANWWDLPKRIRFGIANCTFFARDWYPFHQCWDTFFFWKQKIQKMPALYQSDLNGPR